MVVVVTHKNPKEPPKCNTDWGARTTPAASHNDGNALVWLVFSHLFALCEMPLRSCNAPLRQWKRFTHRSTALLADDFSAASTRLPPLLLRMGMGHSDTGFFWPSSHASRTTGDFKNHARSFFSELFPQPTENRTQQHELPSEHNHTPTHTHRHLYLSSREPPAACQPHPQSRLPPSPRRPLWARTASR
jgi:hypothetical protein